MPDVYQAVKTIYLVEDDPNKIRQIELFFEDSRPSLPSFSLTVKKSYQSGLNAILDNPPDVLLLDMSMPNFDKTIEETGGDFMKFAGEDILKEMAWQGLNTKTIIVTQYDLIGDKPLTELQKYWEEEFKDLYRGTVYYSADESNWKLELLSLLKKYI